MARSMSGCRRAVVQDLLPVDDRSGVRQRIEHPSRGHLAQERITARHSVEQRVQSEVTDEIGVLPLPAVPVGVAVPVQEMRPHDGLPPAGRSPASDGGRPPIRWVSCS